MFPKTSGARLLGLGLLALGLSFSTGCSSRKRSGSPSVSRSPEKADPAVLEAAFQAYEKKDFAQAIQILESARSLGNTSPELYSLLGLAQLQLGKYGPALATLREGSAIHPGNVEISASLGQVHLSQGQVALQSGKLPETESSFREALRASPGREGTEPLVKRILEEAGLEALKVEEFQRTLDILEILPRLGVESNDGRIYRFFSLRALGRDPEAQALRSRVDSGRIQSEDARIIWLEMGGGAPATAWMGGASAEAPSAPVSGTLATGRELLQAGNSRAALQVFQGALLSPDLDPREVGPLLEGAYEAAFLEKNYPLARQLAERRIVEGADAIAAQLDLFEVRVAEGDQTNVLYEAGTFAQQHPTDARVQIYYGEKLARSQQGEIAETVLNQAVQHLALDKEQKVKAYELLAIVAAQKKDMASARSWFEAVVGLDPDHSQSLFNLGMIALQNKRYRESLRFLERAVSSLPPGHRSGAKYNRQLALAYRQNGQMDDFCTTLERILQISSFQDPAHRWALQTQKRSGFCRAETPPEGLSEASAGIQQAFQRLDQGDLEGARKTLAEELKRDAKDPLLRYGLGLVFHRQGDWSKAAVQLEQSLLEKDAPKTRTLLGETYHRLGLYQRAIQTWDGLRTRDPELRSRRQFEMGRAYQALGRGDEALASYEEALNLDPESVHAATARKQIDALLPTVLQVSVRNSTPTETVQGLGALAAAYRSEGLEDRALKAEEELQGLGSIPAGAAPAFPEARVEPSGAPRGAPASGWNALSQAKSLLTQGSREAALEALRAHRKASPQDGEATLLLAKTLLEDPSNLREGFELLSEARQTPGPVGWEATLELIRLYREVGQAEDARFLEEQLRQVPDLPPQIRAQISGTGGP